MQKTYTKLLHITLLIFVAMLSSKTTSFAQQDPMFTQYMFNSLTFNPAYAGSKEYLSANILYRSQWLGWNNSSGLDPDVSTGGAPISQTLTVHSPLNERVGLGLSIVNDKIGVTESTGANVSYAYRIGFADGTLSMALQGGFFNFRSDYSSPDLIARDDINTDPAYADYNPSYWQPNFGLGLFYYTEKFYAGASVPRLLELDLRKTLPQENRSKSITKSYRHLYLTMGGAIPIKGDPNWVFKPSLLVKNVGLLGKTNSANVNSIGAPTEFDIDASILINKTFWIGASFRSSFEFITEQISSYDSVDAWMAFYMKNGLRLGFAYDFSLTRIQNHSVGSFEMSVGYDMNYQVEKVNSPRYFY